MKTELEKIQEEYKALGDRIEALKNEKPKFEVGKWYKNDFGTIVYNDGKFGLSFEKNGMAEYSNDDNFFANIHTSGSTLKWAEAPAKEVEEHLIAEAKKKQLFSKKVACLKGWDKDQYSGEIEGSKMFFTYDAENDTLWLIGANFYDLVVYEKGQWATIQKEDKLFLDKEQKYEIEFKPYNGSGKLICTPNKTVYIAGYVFQYDFFKAAEKLLTHDKASVLLGCDAKTKGTHSWVLTKELNDKILEKLK